jgi:hypothetical protein
VPIPALPLAHCLNPYDVALVKLVLGRPKDIELLRALVAKGTLDIEELRTRYRETRLNERDMFTAGVNLRRLTEKEKPA